MQKRKKNTKKTKTSDNDSIQELFSSISEDAKGSLIVKDDFRKEAGVDQKSNEVKA